MSTVETDMDELFVLVGAIIVFFMQAGFAMLEVGSVNVLNLVESTENVLIKNLFDASLGAVCWWAVGYGMATGDASGTNGFVGTTHFGLRAADFGTAAGDASYARWLFGWAFAATSATIVSGAVAERCTKLAYATYTVAIMLLVYPVIACWAWNDFGWASAYRDDNDALFGCGALDFAGSGVVHVTGGVAALIGAWVVGPREAFRTRSLQTPMYGPIFQSLGTLTMWFSWFAFNAFSGGGVVGRSALVGRAACLTALAGGVGALTASVLGGVLESRDTGAAFKVSIKWGNNGVLAALAASSAGCATSEPVGMVCTALAAAACYVLAARFVKRHLLVDDVVDAAAVHGVGGLVGLVAAPLFATPQHYRDTYLHASAARAAQCAGVLHGGDGSALAANLVFALAIVGWATCCTGGVFFWLHRQLVLRNDVQLGATLDDSQHNNHFLQESFDGAHASRSRSPGRPGGRAPSPRQGLISMASAAHPSSFSLGAANKIELKAEQSLRDVSKSHSNSPPRSGEISFSEKPAISMEL